MADAKRVLSLQIDASVYGMGRSPPLNLFHTGLEFRNERHQQWLQERSELMHRSGGLRNAETIMGILERIWASGDTPDYMNLLSSEGLGNMVPV